MRWLFLVVALALDSIALADEGVRDGSVVSTSGTSAASSKLGPGWKLIYCTVTTHYRTGTSTVTATTSDLTIPATTAWQVYITSAEAYIAFILDSSTGSCSVYRQTPGPTGLPPQHASGGGGSHHITDAGVANLDGTGAETVQVTAGTVCVCSGASTLLPTGCSLVGTALTIQGNASDTATYICTT